MNQQAIANVLTRARSAIGHGIDYKLGEGGVDPNAALPTSNHECDCSGFVAWALGTTRNPKPGREWYIQTDNIWHDAMGPQSVFVRVEEPIPGDVIVYPKIGSPDGYGHTGIWAGPGKFDVVDCCASKNGIYEHWQLAFANAHTIYVRLRQWS